MSIRAYVVLRCDCGAFRVEERTITARGITPRLLCVGDLKAVRRAIPKSTKNLGRREGDPPAIVEVWI